MVQFLRGPRKAKSGTGVSVSILNSWLSAVTIVFQPFLDWIAVCPSTVVQTFETCVEAHESPIAAILQGTDSSTDPLVVQHSSCAHGSEMCPYSDKSRGWCGLLPLEEVTSSAFFAFILWSSLRLPWQALLTNNPCPRPAFFHQLPLC